ncbi:MAG: extracellular solute-binding protein [Leptolyngbyaceae cyanobacterium SL_7_1]|nr:extracellular solute-binding protein [Leptolyngbyaceae cyanobacterium SL_7_1]
MKRRSLLIGAGALALGQGLTGCRASTTALRVQYLQNSMPVQLVQRFEQQLTSPINLDFIPIGQLATLFEQLQQWHQTPIQATRTFWQPLPRSPQHPADLVTLGDYWLKPAIQQQLIQPLPLEQSQGWQRLAPRWQQLVRRNPQGEPDLNGEIWAAPYRWGTLALVYQVEAFERLGWTPTQWSDLNRPEVQQQLSLPDDARVVIGLALKQLGRSINTPTPPSSLAAQLRQLHQQVKFYSSDAYLQPLLLKDTWLAVGWSTDILPVLESDRRFAAVIPSEGTVLTADLWVHPTGSSSTTNGLSPSTSIASEWIEFCWSEAAALELSLLSAGLSPALTSASSQLPTSLQANSLKRPEDTVLQQSEFLQPLSRAATERYQRLWSAIRQETAG